jgi:hypothetical protein
MIFIHISWQMNGCKQYSGQLSTRVAGDNLKGCLGFAYELHLVALK